MAKNSKLTKKEIRKADEEITKLLILAEKSAHREEYSKTVTFYQEMARIAHSINDRRAVDFCLDAVKYGKRAKDNFKTGWSYKCAAEYSLAINDFNNAINFATKAIKYFSDSNSMYIVQWCHNIVGEACEKIKDYDLAMKNYRKSLDIEHSDEINVKIKNIAKIINSKKDNKK